MHLHYLLSDLGTQAIYNKNLMNDEFEPMIKEVLEISGHNKIMPAISMLGSARTKPSAIFNIINL